MSEKDLQRACAACGSGRGELLFEQRFAKIEGISIFDRGYDVVACVRCGFCFADEIPAQSAFDEYYRVASKYEEPYRGKDLAEALRVRFAAEIEDLTPHLASRDARILEMGCATGSLLALLRDAGYPNVMGFDPSPLCAQIGREVHGLDLRAGSLFSAAEHYSDLDAVLVIGVLEHVRDLSEALGVMQRVLKPGGVLFIELPDAERFAEYPDAAFQEFSVEHINYFSRASLATVVEAHGFESVRLAQNARPHLNGARDPVVTAIFRRAQVAKKPSQRDNTAADAVRSYVKQSTAREQPLRDQVAELARAGTPLVVWGCGTLTLRLLATSELGNANIQAFTDSNARYWGRTLHGRKIVPPAELQLGDASVLVSSVGQKRAIAASLRERLGAGVTVLTYPDP